MTTCDDANISELTGRILRPLTRPFDGKAGPVAASDWIAAAVRISSRFNGSQSERVLLRGDTRNLLLQAKHIARSQKTSGLKESLGLSFPSHKTKLSLFLPDFWSFQMALRCAGVREAGREDEVNMSSLCDWS